MRWRRAGRSRSGRRFFLNAISHDLRTPLNGMLLQANLAEIGLSDGDPETVAAAVAEIKNSAKAAAELLNGFLEYARLDWAADNNTITRFDLAELLRDTINLSTAAADERRLYLRGHSPAGLFVETDRSKVDRILLNLIGNALKFTEQGGVRVEVERTGPTVEIHVIDTGVGIDPALQEKLFEEFFQVHNGERDRRKGFGLGLTIAHRLARQIGGDVTVRQRPRTGEPVHVDPAWRGLPGGRGARGAPVVPVGA